MKLAVALALAVWMGAMAPAHTCQFTPYEQRHSLRGADADEQRLLSSMQASNSEQVFRLVQLQKERVEQHRRDNGTARTAVPSPMPQVGSLEEAAARAAPAAGRIIYGQEADECQFPHQVATLTQDGEFCGGSLIAPRWVLTAAHCVVSATSLRVFVGSTEWQKAPHLLFARRIYIHGAYDSYYLNNDIALIDLGEDMPVSDCLKPVELERSGCGDNSLDLLDSVVSGWGLTSDSSTSVELKLRWVGTRTVTNAVCAASYNNLVVIQSTICSQPTAAGAVGTICSGDSGGPLLVESTRRQIGINSFVSSTGCQSGMPSGYARVPCFVNWIDYVMTL